MTHSSLLYVLNFPVFALNQQSQILEFPLSLPETSHRKTKQHKTIISFKCPVLALKNHYFQDILEQKSQNLMLFSYWILYILSSRTVNLSLMVCFCFAFVLINFDIEI